MDTSPSTSAVPGFDVAVLGSHLSSSMLAAILARSGARVTLVDTAPDRARPVGEATVPYTSEVFLLLAERFNVPEFAGFADFSSLPKEVRSTCGVKKSLGFLYHQAGRPHDPRMAVQFNVPGEHTEWHLHRPTVDAYARQIAIKHGAHHSESGSVLSQVQLSGAGGAFTLADGHRFTARYVVDLSGPDSIFLDAMGADSEPIQPAFTSRLLSACMSGVPGFEKIAPLPAYPKATPWSLGTFHHVFDGGWIQIVDFGNHDGSTNARCGVTASVCPETFDDLPADPEEAFRALIARYPGIAEQFAGAVTVGDWVSEPVWQRRAGAAHGARWIALDRAACRAEEVLSRDVTMGAELVHAAASGLLKVLADPACEAAEFSKIAQFQDHLIDFNDDLQWALRTSTRHFQLFNSFTRVWLLWQILADLSLKRARLDCGESWAAVEQFDSGIWFRTPAGLTRLLDDFLAELDDVRTGRIAATAAAHRIFTGLRQEKFVPPLYRFGDPRARYYQFTRSRRLLMLLWVKTVAPQDFRRLLTRDNVTGRKENAPQPPEAASAERIAVTATTRGRDSR